MEITQIIFDLEAGTETSSTGPGTSVTIVNGTKAAKEIEVSSEPFIFFEKIAHEIEHPFCILIQKGSRVDFEVLNEVLQAMQDQQADMAIAQVQDTGQRLSILPRRIEELRFSSLVPMGAVLFTSAHFSKTIQKSTTNTWDTWWYFDLVRHGVSTGLVYLADRVMTRIDRSLPNQARGLVPLVRPMLSSTSAGEPIILIYGAIEASVSLYFEGLPFDLQRQIRFYSPCDPITDLPHLAMASAVIIVRDFEHMATNGLLEILTDMKVPLFWFTDDHLESLRPEYDAFRYYDSAAMKAFLSRVQGVLVSTLPLREVYQKRHDKVILWPPVFDETLAGPMSAEPNPANFHVGAFGGSFRRNSLVDDVMPAIEQLSTDFEISLYLRADLARGMEAKKVVPMPFDSSYRQFVFRWQRLALHAIVHPFGVTRNIGNKSLGSILTARYLGAVPIVAAEHAQRELGEKQGVLVVERDSNSWKEALQQTKNREKRVRLFAALDSWCREEFYPEKSREPYSQLMRMLPDRQAIDMEWRFARALAHPKMKELMRPVATSKNSKRLSLFESIHQFVTRNPR